MMISKHKFGNIFSGGIDSSLQTSLISKYKKPKVVSVLDFINKDEITKIFKNFKNF